MKHTKSQNYNKELTSAQDTNQESILLEIIQENSRLPEKDQIRYQDLLHKCKNQTISEDELSEYHTLLHQLEIRNLKRIEALMALAQIKGKRVR